MIVRLTRRYSFPAAHRLHSPALSDARNVETYGRCNNPFGHGHNYEVELTVRGKVNEVTGRAVDPGSTELPKRRSSRLSGTAI
jgi:6-pyruvoyltetrahydropterin/6-carboxytetrahydropterin synthase